MRVGKRGACSFFTDSSARSTRARPPGARTPSNGVLPSYIKQADNGALP
jgi:hypothetical protein